MNKYRSILFNITGMHCTACSSRLEKKLSELKGVYKSSVNFASSTALVQFHPSLIKEEELTAAADSLGYTMISDESSTSNEVSYKKEIINVVLSWVFTVILFIPMLLEHGHYPLLGLIIAGITILVPGFSIIKSAISSVFSGIMGMDVLLALGAFAAWLTSLLSLLGLRIPDYSMTATMLIAVSLTGRLVETMARGTASKAVKVLANFSGKYAQKVDENGEAKEVLITELVVGDFIQVKAGDKIPTDGIITKGRTFTDESFLTGESLPVEKQVGDYVYGGSLNLEGFITVQVEKDSKSNILAQTIKLIQEAQGSKVPIQVFVDKITTVFVPIILVLSFLCFAIWFAFPHFFPNMLSYFGIQVITESRLAAAISAAISVLVIACPCALGLATPMALVNGSTLGASKGILIRNGSAVQNLCDIDIIALDKTGTLTMGQPSMKSFITNTLSETESLEILAGLEMSSSHPLAKAIIQYTKDLDIPAKVLENFYNIPGQGVFGTLVGVEWFAGSLKSTLEQNIQIPEQLQIEMTKRQDLGETLVCLSNLSTFTCEAIASFSDSITDEAKESIQRLKDMGKKIMMITGDHQNAAQNVADELGIKSVLFDASPKQKLEMIKSLQKQEFKVCFVGDGINDAAALESADVGIAIGTGTDIAAESGDIILVTGSLTSLVLSFKVAKETFNKIKQNLFWAFFYNCIAIPIAFLGLLYPIVAEIAMTLSSLLVIGNSFLLSIKKLS